MKFLFAVTLTLISSAAFAGPTTQAQIDKYEKDLSSLESIVICSNYTSSNLNGSSFAQAASNDLNQIYKKLQEANAREKLRLDHLVNTSQSYELCAIVSKVK